MRLDWEYWLTERLVVNDVCKTLRERLKSHGLEQWSLFVVLTLQHGKILGSLARLTSPQPPSDRTERVEICLDRDRDRKTVLHDLETHLNRYLGYAKYFYER